jgi:hypothetical protein
MIVENYFPQLGPLNAMPLYCPGTMQFDVGPGGDVVFNQNYIIWRFPGSLPSVPVSPNDQENALPLTDGSNVVYVRRSTAGNVQFNTLLRNAAGDTLTLASRADQPPFADYDVENGWVAFGRDGGGGTRQVWVRKPDGTTEQVTLFSFTSVLESLGSDGSMTIRGNGSRYLWRPGQALRRISVDQGRARWVGTTLYLLIGNRVFTVP